MDNQSKNTKLDQKYTNQGFQSCRHKAQGFVLAPQEQILFTFNYQGSVLKNITNSKYCFCNLVVETVNYLFFSYSILTATEPRHDRISQYLDWKFCKYCKIPTVNIWYKHPSEYVTDGVNIIIS